MANRHRVLGWVALVLVLGCAGGGGRPEWFPDPGFGRPDWETKDDLTEGPEDGARDMAILLDHASAEGVDEGGPRDPYREEGLNEQVGPEDGTHEDSREEEPWFQDPVDPPLALHEVFPSVGGASVATQVTLRGEGFGPGLVAILDGVEISSLAVVSGTEAVAEFGPVPLSNRGPKDLVVRRNGQEVLLPSAFTFEFDQDPIVFVHGFMGSGDKDFGVMVARFREMGYPDEFLHPISYRDDTGSSVDQARDELAPFVDEVLAKTGAAKVDLVAHSMGGLSSRLYILRYGGRDKVRDYVSTCGAHHGTHGACATLWWAGAREMCPAWSEDRDSLQWTLNGDPDSEDVDETPFGVEDGGDIAWHAIYSDGDLVILPYQSSCLNQRRRSDCSDPINVLVKGLGHNQVPKDEAVFRLVADFVMARFPARP